MGGDDAPVVPVAAARRAAAIHGLDVVLVGDPAAMHAAGLPAEGSGVAIAPAADVIGMDEEAALAVRARPEASIRVAIGLLAAGRADAVVSAGSTGATMAAALLGVGRVRGIRRPVLAAVLPFIAQAGTAAGAGGPEGARFGAVLVDAGASSDVQPEALVAYARMGIAYARVLGVDAPRVGLLNVGGERGKGNELARAAYGLLSELVEFVGNVEPRAVLTGAVDVVATDGFTGNVFLKTVEAVGARAFGIQANRAAPVGGPGAAVLLGVAGPVLVAHGAADADELVAALLMADRVATSGMVDRLGAVL
ncbi:MAG: phosphate--acyl-ACP acyltransferase [Nitriliruptorales bacterium]|nr:phosphate--acyl-ACP acyltransferase [Nitriliruptorales bacterium]